MYLIEDTIIARSTPPGAGLRGILRLSGSRCVASLNEIFRPRFVPENRPCIVEGNLFPWGEKREIPVRVYFWPEGRGYTGQMSLELHLWGCEPILQAVESRLLASTNNPIRLAQGGEFTLRAFLAGRMDLTQAEAVLGVIDAADERHLHTALEQLAGGIGRPLHRVREDLLDVLTHLEAGFDFVEEDVEFISEHDLKERIQSAIDRFETLLQQLSSRNPSEEMPRVVLIGPPNAGKSRLFNALCGNSEENAIVSPIPGTTRDYLEKTLCWNSARFVLVDTAGILEMETGNSQARENTPYSHWETPDQKAQLFAKKGLENANLLLFCADFQQAACFSERFYEEFFDRFSRNIPILFVGTKYDHTFSEVQHSPEERDQKISLTIPKVVAQVYTSAKTGRGLEELKIRIREFLLEQHGSPEVVPATAIRCRNAIEQALQSLHRALHLGDELLLASELRFALDRLGSVLGTVHTEDILDRVFSRFCIGK